MKSTMKKNMYSVTITQTLEVEADDAEQAEEIAGTEMFHCWEPDSAANRMASAAEV
jgi:hypothetical protein